MKKTRLVASVISVAVLFILALLTVNAEEVQNAKLSPAFDVIASDQKMIKSGLVYENVKFTLTDFKQGLGVSEIDSITVKEIPDASEGVLTVGSMTVGKGQVIYSSLLSMLEFVPASSDVEIASFSFCGDENTSGADITCTVRMLDTVNYAPTVASVHENRLNLEALNGKSVSGMLAAYDPEGDRLGYEIVSYPSHGVITLCDRESGEYVYTSYENYTGTDSFEYVARDEYGNYTSALKVSIEISSDRSNIEFEDMDGAHNLSAATVMVDEGIMDAVMGEDGFVFSPDKEVSRGEFVVMAMKAARKKPKKNSNALDGVSDAQSIEGEAREYISSAVESGYFNAELSDDGVKTLRADAPITKADAALILSRICGYEKNADDIAVFADFYSVDASAQKCISAMYEYGVIELGSGVISPNDHITREACAKMLYRFMSVI